MKWTIAIAKSVATLPIVFLILILSNGHRVQAHHLLLANFTIANDLDSGQIVAIRDLQTGKIQVISGVVAALCDDEFIIRDDTSPIVVKVDLEANNIKLFQGEKVTVSGIYHNEELEAFWIKRTNGELLKLNLRNDDLL
ncbi:MAG: hypothetical protein Tsb0014_11850 [Pleurocapsa sp.]